MNAPTIPIIDLAGSFSGDAAARRTTAGEIDRACRAVGFFYVRNHGIPEALIAGQFGAARDFFALGEAEKRGYPQGLRPGYEPLEGQKFDPNAPGDLKEGFTIGIERGPEHKLVKAGVPRHGANQWPAGLPAFRTQSEAYFQAAHRLGLHIMGLVALALDLPESYFAPFFDDPSVSLRMLHYPPHPADAPARQLGCGAHTDWGSITILAQDGAGGLELQTAAGDWIKALPIPGTFVVNLGDLLARWTNDLYRSTPHRVINNLSGRDRYSLALFLDPHYDARIECLPSCRSAENPPRYRTCTAGEHNTEMYRRTHGQAA